MGDTDSTDVIFERGNLSSTASSMLVVLLSRLRKGSVGIKVVRSCGELIARGGEQETLLEAFSSHEAHPSGRSTHKVLLEIGTMQIESVVDESYIDASASDSLLPDSRHIEIVSRLDVIGEMPLLGKKGIVNLVLFCEQDVLCIGKGRRSRQRIRIRSRIRPRDGRSDLWVEMRSVPRRVDDVALMTTAQDLTFHGSYRVG